MKKTKILIFAFVLVAVFSSVALAETAPKEKDKELTEGKWIELSSRYEIPATVGREMQKPTPELIASWWESFGDTTLTDLIKVSLYNNRDMVVARAKVKEARATLGASKSKLFPWIDSSGTWGSVREPKNFGGTAKSETAYKLGIDASWEIDIFGGRRAEVDASVATLEAQYASLHAAWVTLSSEVAITYMGLRTLQSQLEVAKQNLGLQMEMHDMLQSKYNSGLIDSLALNQEKYTLEQTKASIPPIEANIEQLKNALSVLTGMVPGSLEETLKVRKDIPKANELTLVGIPAEALRQRPDLRVAERELHAQMARKRAAKADLWPKFYLAGSIGTEGLTAGSLFNGPAKMYSWGPKISWPIFHWGAIKNNIKVQGAKEEQLLAIYEKTVLNAVAEVRNALTENIRERERNESLKRAVEASKVALAVANDKYKNGLTDFNSVIIAQKAALSLSNDLIVSEGAISSNLVKVFKALGGGWAPMAENKQ
ncbi:MAG: efflux transporter outer membrane subunit [Synergistaceae bacterium]